VLGHVQDKDGRKMSKHLYNVIDPWEALNIQGADAVRWYFFTASAPWLPSRFTLEAVSEVQRKFMGTLWNTYAFYILYAEIDGFDPTGRDFPPSGLDTMDRWILSRLNSLIKIVDRELTDYHITESARAIAAFVDELSNWYVRRCRERYWQGGMESDKIAAYMTLYRVLYDLSRLIAPFTPFISEMIYQNIVRKVDGRAPLSVHLCDFPEHDDKMIDPSLEFHMSAVLDIVTLGRACRNAAGIKNRQPLSKIYVASANTVDSEFHAIIKDELNIREIEFTDASVQFVSYRFKPQLKTLGPRFGKLLPRIGAYLSSMDAEQAKKELDETGFLKFFVDGSAANADRSAGDDGKSGLETAIELTYDDLLIESARRDDFVAESDSDYTVAIDARLTDELLEEGTTRELISKIQNMRKDAKYNVTDHILLDVSSKGNVMDVYSRNAAAIFRETLADGPLAPAGGEDAYRREWKIGDDNVSIAIKRT
jgi:isoleucyl-tRNA synthetase